ATKITGYACWDYISIPNCDEKRTSPSIMSCISVTPLRNISVRSTPMPNAKPEYIFGSMPAARNTCGCTIPQPPHSTHCGPPLAFGYQTSSSAEGSVNGKKLGRNQWLRRNQTWRSRSIPTCLVGRPWSGLCQRPDLRTDGIPACGWHRVRRYERFYPGPKYRLAHRAPTSHGFAPARCGSAITDENQL